MSLILDNLEDPTIFGLLKGVIDMKVIGSTDPYEVTDDDLGRLLKIECGAPGLDIMIPLPTKDNVGMVFGILNLQNYPFALVPADWFTPKTFHAASEGVTETSDCNYVIWITPQQLQGALALVMCVQTAANTYRWHVRGAYKTCV